MIQRPVARVDMDLVSSKTGEVLMIAANFNSLELDEVVRAINHHTPEREAAVEELRKAAKEALGLPTLSLRSETESSSHRHSEKKAAECYRQMQAIERRLLAALAKLDELEKANG